MAIAATRALTLARRIPQDAPRGHQGRLYVTYRDLWLTYAAMAPYLEQLEPSIELGTSREALLGELKAKNEEELKKLDQEVEDAKTNMGETDLSDVLKQIGRAHV